MIAQLLCLIIRNASTFNKSIEMEYCQLNNVQLIITRSYLNGTSIATIKRDHLPTLNVSTTDSSIKHVLSELLKVINGHQVCREAIQLIYQFWLK